VSAMDSYKKCPKKYHYRYIEKPDVLKQKFGFTEFGSCAHRVLELFHEEIMKEAPPPGSYPVLMKRCFKKAVKEFDVDLLSDPVWTPDGDRPGLPYMREIIQVYLNNMRTDGLPNVIGIETPFNFKINDTTLVRGFIDRVDKVGKNEYRVVDYKTSKNEKYLTAFQLVVYAEAIKRIYKDAEIIHGSYILLKHNCKSIDYKFGLDDLEACRKNIVKKANFIDTDTVWMKKPSILCKWCDYFQLCEGDWTK